MSKDPKKHKLGFWIYDELPDTVRPATEQDLLLPCGNLRLGIKLLYKSQIIGAYVASVIRRSDTIVEIRLMLRDGVVFVKK